MRMKPLANSVPFTLGGDLPPKAQEHLFIPFQGGVRKGGSGLGMGISSKISGVQVETIQVPVDVSGFLPHLSSTNLIWQSVEGQKLGPFANVMGDGCNAAGGHLLCQPRKPWAR
jgi:hypothetical protein